MIICPSGTHDKRDDLGGYAMMPPSPTTPHMITSLGKSRPESVVMPIGIYGSPLSSVFGIQDPRQIHVSFGSVQNTSELGVLAALRELPRCVQNHFGEQVAHWEG